MSVIDKTFGLDTIMDIISDPRKLITEYNKAAEIYGNESNDSIFMFKKDLADIVATLGM